MLNSDATLRSATSSSSVDARESEQANRRPVILIPPHGDVAFELDIDIVEQIQLAIADASGQIRSRDDDARGDGEAFGVVW